MAGWAVWMLVGWLWLRPCCAAGEEGSGGGRDGGDDEVEYSVERERDRQRQMAKASRLFCPCGADVRGSLGSRRVGDVFEWGVSRARSLQRDDNGMAMEME